MNTRLVMATILSAGLLGAPQAFPVEPADVLSKRLDKLAERPETKKVLAALDSLIPKIVDDQVTLTEIPAPTGRESARAQWLYDRLRELGLQDVHIDEVGNLLARRPGQLPKPVVLISAHMDTVFDLEKIEVRRDGAILRAPGIGDDARGLASILAMLRALDAATLKTDGELRVAFTVGEEGLGNLKGVKHLFRDGGPGREANHFITFDGHEEESIVHRALGSVRFRVVMRGPGGHSWADFGRPNPVQALGRLMVCMAPEPYLDPAAPQTSVNFGRIGGGTSINAIPQEGWVEVDMRSEDATQLARMESALQRCAKSAVEAEKEWSRSEAKRLEVELQPVGRRPSGTVAVDAPIVALADAISRRVGIRPNLDALSTDANVAISLGLSALGLGVGGNGANSHSPDEWYDPTGCERAMHRNLLLVLALLAKP